MNNRKIILIISIAFFLNSCGGTWDSVKRGLTGEKVKSTDEFLVEKKDPLILPPNFDELPTPGESLEAREKISEIQETLGKTTLIESSSSASSAEESILQQIKKK